MVSDPLTMCMHWYSIHYVACIHSQRPRQQAARATRCGLLYITVGMRMCVQNHNPSEHALQEFSKHDEQPSKYIKTYSGHNPKTGQDFSCDVAYERFLGPELFFQPEIYSSDYTVPLPQVRICTFATAVHCAVATAVHYTHTTGVCITGLSGKSDTYKHTHLLTVCSISLKSLVPLCNQGLSHVLCLICVIALLVASQQLLGTA